MNEESYSGIALAVRVFGWICFVLALGIFCFALVGGGFLTALGPISGVVLAGVLFMGFAEIIHRLTQIERHLRSTDPTNGSGHPRRTSDNLLGL